MQPSLWRCAASSAAAIVLSASAHGAVNLELRPVSSTVLVGNTVSVGLYAVSDSASNQTVAAIDAILFWNPSLLLFTGNNQVGAVPLLASTFFSPDGHGLNESTLPTDGDAMYSAFAQFNNPFNATPAGTLVTTFTFTALAQTPGTPISLPASAGSPAGFTTVFGGGGPNINVTGSIGGTTITVIPAPMTGAGMLAVGGLVAARRRH